MKFFLKHIRYAKNDIPIWKQIMLTIGILIFGIALGTFSKYLDCHQTGLPYILGILDNKFDIHNFLGRFAPWILIAVFISVYSKTSVRAGVNVFMFFVGMVSSYYLYSQYVGGFFPRNYALIWVGFTMASPFLAYICWYAKGTGNIAIAISAGIIALLFNTAFSYGIFYFNIRYVLEVAILIITIGVLRRTRWETFVMIVLGIIIANILNIILPFRFW